MKTEDEKVEETSKLLYKLSKNKKSVLIPLNIRPKAETKNKMGYTMAQWWVILCKSNPPKWTIHNPLITNYNGNTCMMLWIKYANDKHNIPAWMIHDSRIKNGNDKSPITLWYYYTIHDLPNYLHNNVKISDNVLDHSIEDIIDGSERSYRQLPKSINQHSRYILSFCKKISNKSQYILPRILYEKYTENFETIYGTISEEIFQMVVSKKYKRIIDENIIYWDLT